MAIMFWEGCGLKGSLGFRSLLNKNLVELEAISDRISGNEDAIRMHDHLRDMGRHLANYSGLPRRIWRTEDFEDLLQQSSVVTEVRGISQRDEVPSFSGCKIRNLQLLDINCSLWTDGLLESIMNTVQSPNLIWLRTDNRTYCRLRSSFPLTKLRVLEVFEEFSAWTILQSLWHEESQPPLQLRELVIESPFPAIPKSIGLLKHLERFVADNPYGEGRLNELPEEFGELLSLKYLRLACECMISLPYSFGNLTSLKHIDLSRCYTLERLPDSFGNLTNLKHIDLSGCEVLKSLPDSFGNLTRLVYLDLHGCYALTMSRETLRNICTLQYIDLTGCSSIEALPSQFTHQWSLEILELTDLASLIALRRDIGELSNLKRLQLWNCGKLMKDLPDSVESLNQLTELTIHNCSLCLLSFKMIEGEVESICPSLKYLKITCCDALVEVGRLPNALIDLELADCPNLRKIEWLSSFKTSRAEA